MQDTVRLFVAAPLPEALKVYLDEARQEYTDDAVRHIPVQNLHLTLYFIGNVPVQEQGSIRETLRQVAQKHQPFTLELEQLEPGPKARLPRLVWARFRPNAAFTHLSQELTQVLSPTPPRQEKFIPHVTVCRFRKEGTVPRHLSIVAPVTEVLYPVNTLALWKSTLGSPHPVYSVLEEFPLGGE
ncbi:2'-5' RNA ligase [Rufibacter radiotolerans]|uniref:RNA 2',3'-cyclic phosphodiesterase n=1 Tax=Rufibacter radiotolerans TaxID=1379910 RepID=A0A0H4VIM7_9BACT|nr:RNA 2',3'-cyclic phosphodiesterase [Rufibacter radiotolerans]AKQ45645.1 2'-5' RNA ligase [Rufibacter radiotolerans]